MSFTSLSSKGFIGNSVKLLSGNIGGQIIIVCTIPIITRIYPPELFGVFALFVTFSQIFSSFSSLRYANAILKPKKENDAASIVWLSFAVGLFVTLCFWGTVKLLLPNTLFVGAWCTLHQQTTLLFTSSYVGSMILTLNFWLIRRNLFSSLGVAKVLEASSSRTSIISLGLMGHVSSLGLISSFIFGQLTSFLTMSFSAVRTEWQLLKDGLNLGNIKAQALIFSSFALYSPSILFNSARREFPVLAMAFFFDPILVGYYALCQRVIGQPLGVMGDALSRSFFQKAAELQQNGEKSNRIALKLFQFQLLLTVVPCVLFSLASREIFSLVFGLQWQAAGRFLNIVWPFFLCPFFFRPLSVFFDLLGKQKQLFAFDFTLFSLSVLAFSIGGVKHDPYLALLLFTVVNLACYGFTIRKLLIHIGCSSMDIYHAIRIPLLCSVLFGSVSWAGKKFFSYDSTSTIILTLILGLLYLAYIVPKLKFLMNQR